LEQSKKHTKRIIDEQAEYHGFKDIMHGAKMPVRPATLAPKKPKTTKSTTTKPPEDEPEDESEDEEVEEENNEGTEESENDVRRRRREDEEVSEDEIEETEDETEAETETEEDEDKSEDKDKKKPKPKKPKPTMSAAAKEEAREKLEKERLAREAKYKEYLQWRAVYLKKDLPKKFNWGNQTVHRYRIKDSNDTKEIPYHCQSLE